MLIFVVNPEKNVRSKDENQPENSTHMCRGVRESNPDHIGGSAIPAPPKAKSGHEGGVGGRMDFPFPSSSPYSSFSLTPTL